MTVCLLWGTRRVTILTDAPVHFGLIPHDHWYQPDWIDEEKATAARDEMVKNQVIYGGTSRRLSSRVALLTQVCLRPTPPALTFPVLLSPLSDNLDGLAFRERAIQKHVYVLPLIFVGHGL